MLLPAPIVVFVRPQAPGNLGALARAMSNFGATELRVVKSIELEQRLKTPSDAFQTMDWALARRGESILKNATYVETVHEALEDIQVSVGTSGRTTPFQRGYDRPILGPKEAWQEVQRVQKLHPKSFKWALVLGPEDDGLHESESSCCNMLIRIPTADQNPSLNVAMAAGVLLYDVYQLQKQSSPTSTSSPIEPASEPLPPHAEREHLVAYALRALEGTQFFKYPDSESVAARLRRLLQQSTWSKGDLLFVFEMIYQLKSKAEGHYGERNFFGTLGSSFKEEK